MKPKKTPKKEETIPKKLLNLKKKTSWSWERMCRELHRVMGEEGPSHTTLFRYALGKVQRRNVLTERYVGEAIHKITVELIQQEQRESETQREDGPKELHQTEIRFRNMVENAKDLIYRYRLAPTRGYEYISPVIKDMLGYEPKDFYADPDLDLKLVHPDDRHRLEQAHQGVETFQESATLRYRHRDGRVIWCERVNVPIYDKAGNLLAMEGIARDVTDRKEFEQALLFVIQGTAWTAADFPRTLVKQLAAALQVRFAFLAELHPTIKNRACLLALWDGSGYGNNFEYDIEHKPCEHVFTNDLSFYPADLQQTFPKDAWLKENGLESYLAVPVYGPTGKPIGHLGVLHDDLMPEGLPRESILRVFATCAGNELAHMKRAKVS
jgi:PAS domain S-box-containing protein